MSSASVKRAKSQPRNVTKSRPNPKRSFAHPENDHPMGLWLNTEFLRKLTKRDPITLLGDNGSTAHNRYLELADLALSPNQAKKKKAG